MSRVISSHTRFTLGFVCLISTVFTVTALTTGWLVAQHQISQAEASPNLTVPADGDSAPDSTDDASATVPPRQLPAPPPGGAITQTSGDLTSADGVLPDGAGVVDDQYPGIAKLNPDLLKALRAAAKNAAASGVEFQVTSGWRSVAYQDQLLREAVAQYGSEEEAARWVATVDTSPHVSGDAVDIGPTAADVWLSAHGAAYGLCQIYGNEPWHFELRTVENKRCPLVYPDPTYDPRMH